MVSSIVSPSLFQWVCLLEIGPLQLFLEIIRFYILVKWRPHSESSRALIECKFFSPRYFLFANLYLLPHDFCNFLTLVLPVKQNAQNTMSWISAVRGNEISRWQRCYIQDFNKGSNSSLLEIWVILNCELWSNFYSKWRTFELIVDRFLSSKSLPNLISLLDPSFLPGFEKSRYSEMNPQFPFLVSKLQSPEKLRSVKDEDGVAEWRSGKISFLIIFFLF